MDRKAWGGISLIVAGTFLGRETLIWLIGKTLDAASSFIQGGIQFASLSWQNSAAMLLVLAGCLLAFWPRPKTKVVAKDTYGTLVIPAENIISRIRVHRAAEWFERERQEPTPDIARAGLSLLLTFEKAGYIVPRFDGIRQAESICVGLEGYFTQLVQLLADGHTDEAKRASENASEHAVRLAAAFKMEKWSTARN